MTSADGLNPGCPDEINTLVANQNTPASLGDPGSCCTRQAGGWNIMRVRSTHPAGEHSLTEVTGD